MKRRLDEKNRNDLLDELKKFMPGLARKLEHSGWAWRSQDVINVINNFDKNNRIEHIFDKSLKNLKKVAGIQEHKTQFTGSLAELIEYEITHLEESSSKKNDLKNEMFDTTFNKHLKLLKQKYIK